MIGIIGAMESEIHLLRKELEETVMTQRAAGMDFTGGILAARMVVIAYSGVGKVNAAACTQAMIDRFHPRLIINTGIAGAAREGLKIGDVVISTDAVQHDVDVSALGYAPGCIPGTRGLVADPYSISKALACIRKMEPGTAVVAGRVASGDQFVAGGEAREKIMSLFTPACIEMEGAAIAQVASKNGIPFLIIRIMSDNADGGAVKDYRAFEKEAADRLQKMVKEIIKEL